MRLSLYELSVQFAVNGHIEVTPDILRLTASIKAVCDRAAELEHGAGSGINLDRLCRHMWNSHISTC